MKKQTQMLAVLSAAAFMALLPSFIGQPQTVYAAECGWTEEDGSMVFYDEDGELLTDTWRKEENEWINKRACRLTGSFYLYYIR